MTIWFRLRAQKLQWGALITFSIATLLLVFRSSRLTPTDPARTRTSPSHEQVLTHHESEAEGKWEKTTAAMARKATVEPHSSSSSAAAAAVQPTNRSKPLFVNQEDEYEEDATYLKPTCPDSIRKRIAKTELQHFFLPTIPVLQWKKHATQAEYERLRRYSGAQGWMEVDWHILNETLNLLNSSANGYMFDDWQLRHPVSSPCIRCAVVGNGGILNGSKVGAEIDQHDYVFRVNAAILKGFQEDVGNRTSFYVFSANTMLNSLNNYASDGFHELPKSTETRYIFLPDHDLDYLLLRGALKYSLLKLKSLGRPSRYFGQNLTTEKFKILHPDFMRYLRNRLLWDPVLNTEDKEVYRASTGATMLLAAVHTCDQVSAYGFITPDYDKYSDHYYDKTYKKLFFYLNHNLELEMKLWQKLKKNGIIKLYSRQ